MQHAHTYTIGKRGSDLDFLHGLSSAHAAGAEVVNVPRGGETTYHGPGQLIAYPIVNLRHLRIGPRAYVEALEDIMIATAARYGIKAEVSTTIPRPIFFLRQCSSSFHSCVRGVLAQGRLPGRTGVWVGERKLGAIGVAISGGVTRHGLALNVSTDLGAFRRIVACGDPDREATSLARELGGAAPPLAQVAEGLAETAAMRLGFSSVKWLPDVNTLAKQLRAHGSEEAVP